MTRKNLKGNKGFTLVELIVVIAVIALLAVLAAVAFRNVRENARAAALAADVNRINGHVETFLSLRPAPGSPLNGFSSGGSETDTHWFSVPSAIEGGPRTRVQVTASEEARTSTEPESRWSELTDMAE